MRYSWTKALPYILGLSAALVQAALAWTGTVHVTTTNGIAIVAAAHVLGDWLRAQINIWQNKYPVPEVATLHASDGELAAWAPTHYSSAMLDQDLVRRVVETHLRQSIEEKPIAVPPVEVPPLQ